MKKLLALFLLGSIPSILFAQPSMIIEGKTSIPNGGADRYPLIEKVIPYDLIKIDPGIILHTKNWDLDPGILVPAINDDPSPGMFMISRFIESAPEMWSEKPKLNKLDWNSWMLPLSNPFPSLQFKGDSHFFQDMINPKVIPMENGFQRTTPSLLNCIDDFDLIN